MSKRRHAATSDRSGRTPSTGGSRRHDGKTAARTTPASLVRMLVLPGLVVVAVLAAVGIFVLSGGLGGSTGSTVLAARPILGEASAPVVIHEYGDFQCPSCGSFARSVEPQLRAAYIDTGKVRLVWHDFAWIGAESRDAANAARCAGDQSRFWEFHDLLYQSQNGENQGAFTRDRLKAMGMALALDSTLFDACVDAGKYVSAVNADFSDVRTKGFNGTPTFLIGDQRIVGAQPFEVFANIIDAQLGLR